jgi:hypothetical protein
VCSSLFLLRYVLAQTRQYDAGRTTFHLTEQIHLPVKWISVEGSVATGLIIARVNLANSSSAMIRPLLPHVQRGKRLLGVWRPHVGGLQVRLQRRILCFVCWTSHAQPISSLPRLQPRRCAVQASVCGRRAEEGPRRPASGTAALYPGPGASLIHWFRSVHSNSS